jgi:NDP-sugar pyrophosphorylase family protein
MSLTLVVLAAGMGSRYGGLKQIDPVGPGGETVLDYAVFDALRAGFTRVVFVIRRDFEVLFRQKIGGRYTGRAHVEYVFQSMDAVPAGYAAPAAREKPWGTGHAVWCVREAVAGNFAVINADDFYGADSFAQLLKFLRERKTAATEFAMVGFRLANTLSEHGTVARGVTTAASSGELQSIVEETGIAATDVGLGRKYSGQEIVSMNCWGFTPALFPRLDAQFREFLGSIGARARARTPAPAAGAGDGAASPTPDPIKAEFYLPAAVSAMIARDEVRVRVLPTDGTWFGITYRDDKPRVEAELAALVQAGRYPAKLWAT